jgi:hypothetical protein
MSSTLSVIKKDALYRCSDMVARSGQDTDDPIKAALSSAAVDPDPAGRMRVSGLLCLDLLLHRSRGDRALLDDITRRLGKWVGCFFTRDQPLPTDLALALLWHFREGDHDAYADRLATALLRWGLGMEDSCIESVPVQDALSDLWWELDWDRNRVRRMGGSRLDFADLTDGEQWERPRLLTAPGWWQVRMDWGANAHTSLAARSAPLSELVAECVEQAAGLCARLCEHDGDAYLPELMRFVATEERVDRRSRVVSLLAWDLLLEAMSTDPERYARMSDRLFEWWHLVKWWATTDSESYWNRDPVSVQEMYDQKLDLDQEHYRALFESALLGILLETSLRAGGLLINMPERVQEPDIQGALPILRRAVESSRRGIRQSTWSPRRQVP